MKTQTLLLEGYFPHADNQHTTDEEYLEWYHVHSFLTNLQRPLNDTASSGKSQRNYSDNNQVIKRNINCPSVKTQHNQRSSSLEDVKRGRLNLNKSSMNSLTNKTLRTLSTSHCLTDTMTTSKLLPKYRSIPVKQNECWPSSTCLSQQGHQLDRSLFGGTNFHKINQNLFPFCPKSEYTAQFLPKV